MNFYTPQRMPNETFEHYKIRQKEQKHYLKRSCYFYRVPYIVRGNRVIGISYKKEIE